MSTGFKQATVNASSVPATQTNFPGYVDLSRLGITTLAEAQSVRVYANSSKTTEWAREIVSATEMHVKIPSLTSTTSMYVDWDGIRADYAVTDTYGRNAVWSGYGVVLHMGNTVNSTGNTAMTLVGSPSLGTGKISDGYVFTDASNQYGYVADEAANSPSGNLELSTWINYTTLPTSGIIDAILTKDTAGTSQRSFWVDYYNNGGTKQLRFGIHVDGAATNFSYSTLNHNLVTGTPTLFVFRATPANDIATKFEFLIDGASLGNGTAANSGTGATSIYNSTTNFLIGRYSGAYPETDALFDEVRLYAGNRANTWHTTEYNNQSDESTFWGTWSAVGGGGANTTNFFAMMG